MCVGFYAQMTPNDDQQQRVSYLMPINQPLTNKSVVLETILRALKIADECDENYVQVTYDLGIGMIALPLQNTELNQFKRLFVHIGDFHVQMAYMKALGSFISDCGLATILVESYLLGSGSINGFLSGKNFNKCKRLHILMSLRLEIAIIQNDFTLQNILEEFKTFKKQTLEGSYGKKQQYYGINKPFSCILVDLTLEQTINADAGRKLTGITFITNSISARQRLSINHGLRCALISAVMEQSGLSNVQEVTNDLLPQRLKKSKTHISQLTTVVFNRINPFSLATTKKVLVNISSGQAGLEEVTDFL
ncbi:hypothetical protein TKK_0016155 [Trichogramma kaykai]